MVRVWSLSGNPSYEGVRQLQLKLLELRAADECPDTLLFLEHSPVITRGRGLQYTGVARDRHMPLFVSPEDPRFAGIEFAESERGGDLTYHGPGQWILYPICKLGGKGWTPFRDIEKFLRNLEQLVIDELTDRGLILSRKENAAGVWVGDRKIASLGIAVKKWVTYHGVALNCVNDLKPFSLISPCGFDSSVMTRLGDLLPLSPDWRIELENSFLKRISAQVGEPLQLKSLSLAQAQAICEIPSH